MENFKHLLLIRFNLDYSPHTGNPYACDEEWHKERFELFQRFCLPSIIQQTSKNFKLLIFFNEEKQKKYHQFIEETKESDTDIDFFFVKPEEDHRAFLKKYINDNITSDYLITTRIDNDDAISVNFIESIQYEFTSIKDSLKGDHIILNAGNGYQFETKFPFRKSKRLGYNYSPFISLVSKIDPAKTTLTVLSHSHLAWKGFSEAIELPVKMYWAQIIHKKNVSNKILTFQLLPNISDPDFPVLKGTPKNHFWFGVFMLPLQFIITLFQRVEEKVRKLRR